MLRADASPATPMTVERDPRRTPAAGTAAEEAAPAVQLEHLARGHYREIWRLLRRLGVPWESLDDTTQHVFLVAAQRPDAIRAGSERAFLVSVAVRTAANARRSVASRRARHTERDTESLATAAVPTDELVDQKRLRELLDEALDELPADSRAVFVLFELEGMTLDEMAEALSIPRGTVASRLRRARSIFQETARRIKAAYESSDGRSR